MSNFLLNRLVNPLMRWLLSSSIHSVVSQEILLLSYTGRKSGRAYSTPVNYIQDGQSVWLMSDQNRVWWRNLQGGSEVGVMIQGVERHGWATVVLEEEAVMAKLTQLLQLAPQFAKLLNVTLDDVGGASDDQIREAAHDRVLISITLQ